MYAAKFVLSALFAFGAMAMIDAPAGAAPELPPMESIKSSATTQAARQAYLENLHKNTIEGNLALPLNKENESKWDSAFWGMGFSLYKSPTALAAVRKALDPKSGCTDSLVKSALDAACTLYPSELEKEMTEVTRQTSNAKNFAEAAHYLVRQRPEKAKGLLDLMRRRFKDSATNPLLTQLMLCLEKPFNERVKSRPPLIDLLKQKFPADAPVVFSFQRSNRDYPGLAIIRKPDGTFVRRADGSVFSISQLARSMSNCPGYITNGNTPQGIFTIQGLEVSSLKFIGPTPFIRTMLPIEASPADYLHDKVRASEKWSKELYRSMLPESWRGYVPIYEAYAAGETGRNSMICHGTTVDPEFYKGQPYYPNSPTMGCMCALEMWSAEDGHCVYSDQHALVEAYSSLGNLEGFLVVVELDNQARPVTLYDVASDLLEAERR